MTSYDEENGGPDFSPAYGIHLHDTRLLEYVGAPESARLLSHSPEYWLHHMRRRFRLRSSSRTTRVSSYRTFRSCSSLLHHSTERLPRSCVLPLSGAVSGGCGAEGGAVSPCSTGGALHGCHGIEASTQYAGDSVTAFWIYLSSSV